jgi:hypothetical protein
VAGLALAFATSLAHAGKIDYVDKFASGDGVVAMLYGDSNMFADAYREKIVKDGLTAGGNGKTWRYVQAKTHTPTVARMEYAYTKDGQVLTRIYHARSGPAMDVVIRSQNFAAPDSTPSSGTESGESRPYEITEDDIAADFAERTYYPADTPFNVRAPNLPSEKSIIQSLLNKDGKDINKADAELKIFRQIEKDINEGVVTRGGQLTGYVSKVMCESCGPASADLAEHFDISGNIHQLVEPGAEMGAAEAAVKESVASSNALKSLRKAYASEHFRINAVTAPSATRSWAVREAVERVEAAEAAAAAGARCAH